jgi:hypothetical protein
VVVDVVIMVVFVVIVIVCRKVNGLFFNKQGKLKQSQLKGAVAMKFYNLPAFFTPSSSFP